MGAGNHDTDRTRKYKQVNLTSETEEKVQGCIVDQSEFNKEAIIQSRHGWAHMM